MLLYEHNAQASGSAARHTHSLARRACIGVGGAFDGQAGSIDLRCHYRD